MNARYGAPEKAAEAPFSPNQQFSFRGTRTALMAFVVAPCAVPCLQRGHDGADVGRGRAVGAVVVGDEPVGDVLDAAVFGAGAVHTPQLHDLAVPVNEVLARNPQSETPGGRNARRRITS